jgi:hypothetical protein
MLSRFLLVPLIALSPFSCGNEHAGLSRAAAVKAAKDYVVRVDYRSDEPLFYRNTGNRRTVVRSTRDASGHPSWSVRFDDLQAMHRYCITARRDSPRVMTRGTAC